MVRVARVTGQFLLGLLCIAITAASRRAARRSARGFALLARFGCAVAERAGTSAAVLTASRARRRVPAFRQEAVGAHPWRRAFRSGSLTAYLAELPVLDKASYVDRYSIQNRCQGGRLPLTAIEVDESSGSSGRPYQWVRSRAELDEVERNLGLQAEYLLRAREHRRVVVLNCFSMGAWATGATVTGALRRIGTIKSCGPDTHKALAAMELLGADACYVVCGYPPFLGAFLDAAQESGVDLAQFELWGFVGGEGMTEAFRGRLEQQFRSVISAYGASDLDIGVAGETRLAIAVRQAAASRPEFAEALFGTTARLPMVFQYDPSSYFVEVLDGELLVTVTRSLLSPRIRYAVHDAGGTISYADLIALARTHGVDLPRSGSPRAPFLYVSGRADSTVSHMGANLYPEDVDAALQTLLDPRLGSFCIELTEAADGSTSPVIHIEAEPGADRHEIQSGIAGWLVAHNRDWAAAYREDPRAPYFDIQLTEPGTGVFAINAERIKRRYILASA